jgi:ATP-dependent Clp protease protease subunit
MQSYEIGPPPDLPSLLLANRIIYIGMPLVPSVTELVIAQLLYLNYQNEEIITMYINSPGTNSPDGRAFSFDTEAFAIADTMQFIRPPIRTIAVGQAFGTAAMLLSLGQKGNRFALPNASIMLNQPRSRARGQASDVAIKAREILNNRKVTNEFLAKVGETEIYIFCKLNLNYFLSLLFSSYIQLKFLHFFYDLILSISFPQV